MKRGVIFVILLIIFMPINFVNAELIIVNHNAVDDFNAGNIPDYWINQIKEQNLLVHWVGQSHSMQIVTRPTEPQVYGGLELLEQIDPKYAVEIECKLTNVDETNVLRIVKGQYMYGRWYEPWQCRFGDEHYWANEEARQFTENSISQAAIEGKPIKLSGWAWSFDIVVDNMALDEDSTQITFNDERMSTYLSSLERFNNNTENTTVIYLTAVTDDNTYNGPDYIGYRGWRVTKYNQEIRDAAIQLDDGILFDQAEIENWNVDNTERRIDYWVDDQGITRQLELRHQDYNGDGCAHGNPEVCLKKGKAFWWMMARVAGWDGTPACHIDEDCGNNQQCNQGICEIQEPYCGDGTCDINEACYTCQEDCGRCGKIKYTPTIVLSPYKNWWNKLLELFVPR